MVNMTIQEVIAFRVGQFDFDMAKLRQEAIMQLAEELQIKVEQVENTWIAIAVCATEGVI